MTEIALLDWVPRKVLLDEDDVDALPRVLRAFVVFAAREKDLAAEHLAETLAAIDQFEPQFREAMADDEQAGPAKALVRQMLAEGVDLQDPEAQERWIAEFNARSFEERDDILQ